MRIKELLLSNCGTGKDSRVPWTAGRSNKSILKEINPEYTLKGLMLKLQYLGHLMQRADSLKRPWCWERLKAGGEAGTEDEMVGWHHRLNGHEFELWETNSGRQLRTGKPGMLLLFMGSERVRHDLANEQQRAIFIKANGGGGGLKREGMYV